MSNFYSEGILTGVRSFSDVFNPKKAYLLDTKLTSQTKPTRLTLHIQQSYIHRYYCQGCLQEFSVKYLPETKQEIPTCPLCGDATPAETWQIGSAIESDGFSLCFSREHMLSSPMYNIRCNSNHLCVVPNSLLPLLGASVEVLVRDFDIQDKYLRSSARKDEELIFISIFDKYLVQRKSELLIKRYSKEEHYFDQDAQKLIQLLLDTPEKDFESDRPDGEWYLSDSFDNSIDGRVIQKNDPTLNNLITKNSYGELSGNFWLTKELDRYEPLPIYINELQVHRFAEGNFFLCNSDMSKKIFFAGNKYDKEYLKKCMEVFD